MASTRLPPATRTRWRTRRHASSSPSCWCSAAPTPTTVSTAAVGLRYTTRGPARRTCPVFGRTSASLEGRAWPEAARHTWEERPGPQLLCGDALLLGVSHPSNPRSRHARLAGGYLELVKFLLNAGADVNAANRYGAPRQGCCRYCRHSRPHTCPCRTHPGGEGAAGRGSQGGASVARVARRAGARRLCARTPHARALCACAPDASALDAHAPDARGTQACTRCTSRSSVSTRSASSS